MLHKTGHQILRSLHQRSNKNKINLTLNISKYIQTRTSTKFAVSTWKTFPCTPAWRTTGEMSYWDQFIEAPANACICRITTCAVGQLPCPRFFCITSSTVTARSDTSPGKSTITRSWSSGCPSQHTHFREQSLNSARVVLIYWQHTSTKHRNMPGSSLYFPWGHQKCLLM